jgi:hypothetical protein
MDHGTIVVGTRIFFNKFHGFRLKHFELMILMDTQFGCFKLVNWFCCQSTEKNLLGIFVMWLEGTLLCTIIPPPCKWVFCFHGGLYGKHKAPTLWKLHGFLCHIMPTGEGITKIGLALVSHLACPYFSNALILGPYPTHTPLCYPGECITLCECACWQSSMHVHRNEYAHSKYQRKFFQNSFFNVFMCSPWVLRMQ